MVAYTHELLRDADSSERRRKKHAAAQSLSVAVLNCGKTGFVPVKYDDNNIIITTLLCEYSNATSDQNEGPPIRPFTPNDIFRPIMMAEEQLRHRSQCCE